MVRGGPPAPERKSVAELVKERRAAKESEKSNKISQAEEQTSSEPPEQTREERIRERALKLEHQNEWSMFSYLDPDSVGCVSTQEFVRRMEVLGYGRTAKDILEHMGDANARFLTFEAFVHGWTNLMSSSHFKAMKVGAKAREWDASASSKRDQVLGESEEEDAPVGVADDSGAEAYEAACASQGCIPSNSLLRMLRERKAGCYANKYNIGQYGGAALAEALKVNQFVTKLVLPGNGLGDRGALAIARALASSSVTSLDISDNGVTGIGAVAVAEALEDGARIAALDISNNNIFNAVPELAKVLANNRSLTELNLSRVKATNKSGSAIGNMLVSNRKLLKLQMCDNPTITLGWINVFTALEQNATLKLLDVSNNCLKGKLGKALFAALAVNVTLATIDVEKCNLDRDAVSQLATTLRENTSLEIVMMDPEPGSILVKDLEKFSSNCRLVVSDHSRSVRWKPCDARAASQHSDDGGGGDEGLAFDGSEKWSSTLGVSMDASRPNTSKFLELKEMALPLFEDNPEAWDDPPKDSWFQHLTEELNHISEELYEQSRPNSIPAEEVSLCPEVLEESTSPAAPEAGADHERGPTRVRIDCPDPPPPEAVPSAEALETPGRRANNKALWARVQMYEALVDATEKASLQDPHNLAMLKHKHTARTTLKVYHEMAFKHLQSMEQVTNNDVSAGFRMALKELNVRRHRHVIERPVITVKVKSLVRVVSAEPEAVEQVLVKGYEDILNRRIQDLVIELHGEDVDERQSAIKRCRSLLLEHDVALRRIWDYYMGLNLRFMLESPSCIEDGSHVEEEHDRTGVFFSAQEEGRLHTRQWLQLLRDAEMCSPLCSAAEINRLSAEVIQHPDVVDEVFDDPHGPYMSRVGYFEWIEMLFRVAFIQCSKAKSVSKRLEMLLTERVLPKGGVDSRDMLTASLWSCNEKHMQIHNNVRANLIRIYRHFSTIEHLSNEKKPGPGVLMKMMQNRYDIENGLHPTISCKCLNLLSQEYKYKTPEGEIVFARNVHELEPKRAALRVNVYSTRTKIVADFDDDASAVSKLRSSRTGKHISPDKLVDRDDKSPERQSSDVKRSQRMGSGRARESAETEANRYVVPLHLEGDRPQHMNDMLQMMEKLTMFSPELNYQKTVKICSTLLNNKELLPQQHVNNTCAEICHDQWIELLARYAMLEGGKAAQKLVKDKGAWVMFEKFLMATTFPAIQRIMPGKFVF